ncbi:serine/threonine-protein kinase [Streptomyces lushanensis]|uniref:serine/threonine-protein kinase n=1 Tax=Streptomyces lushanensis TaxID=1434255 RepID=UPI00082DBE7E|nr:serine/threonine-protein kinase [Streptomyces lushanensis]
MSGRGLIGGRYRLLRTIGAGGMGVVHEAQDTELDRRVAIKILSAAGAPPDTLDTKEMAERFRREARALARITGPHTAALHDFGVLDGAPYLVMEFLDGVDMQTLVARQGRLPEATVIAVSAGVCAGLAAAHAAGVLHRDVKPTNVRITLQGRVVLQDFGLARLIEDTAITRVGALIGTPRYMAPEVMRGERPGPAGDLYGLGLCMYLMLTGEPPLDDAEDVGTIVERAIDEGTPRLTGSRHLVSSGLAELVDFLSAREPSLRPAGADAALAVLQSVQTSPGAVRALGDMVRGCIRDGAVEYVHHSSAVETSYPEYFDTGFVRGFPGQRPDHELSLPRSLPLPLSLSDMTRQTVLGSMTAENALSRQREAVNLVLRGQLQDAVRVFTSVVQVCTTTLGADHPTTLTSQYWQAVCLARLGASGEALALFSRVSAHVEQEQQGRDTSIV